MMQSPLECPFSGGDVAESPLGCLFLWRKRYTLHRPQIANLTL